MTKDWELCIDVAREIEDKYGYDASFTDFSDEEIVVMAVMAVTGRVNNGGFYYLFESLPPGDPTYQLSLNAFKKIGCQKAVKAFELALKAFENRGVPKDDKKRIKLFKKIPIKIRDQINSLFFSAGDEIGRKLADYIRSGYISSFEQETKHYEIKSKKMKKSSPINEEDEIIEFVCEAVENICDYCEDSFDDNRLSEEQFVVIAVNLIMGTICEGGFLQLFESRISEAFFSDDPTYKRCFEAFHKLGYQKGFEAYKQVQNTFPNNEIPKEKDRQITLYKLVPKETRDNIDEYFKSDMDGLFRLLSEYIRMYLPDEAGLNSQPGRSG